MVTIENPYYLLANGKKFIGWGTGGCFDYFYSICPLPLAYLIDNAENAWGQRKIGLDICNPSCLLRENPDEIVIIVYSSFFNEITSQLKNLGSFRFLNASNLFCDDHQIKWRQVEKILRKGAPSLSGLQNSAVLIQGPVLPELTAQVIAVHARCQPTNALILSTWEDTESHLLDEVTPLVDKILLNPKPIWHGAQNRNFQIVSSLEGLRYCRQQGIQRVLKTRSDMFVMAPNLLSQCEHLLSLYDKGAARRLGLENRILIPQTFTRKYLLYHISDMVMYGATGDLLQFWDCALDEREFNLIDLCRTVPLKQLAVHGFPSECYFGINFCHNLGRPVLAELEDSWNFFRDFFLVADNGWFDLFWPKNPHIPDTITLQLHRETVSNRFWNSLVFDSPYLLEARNQVDITKIFWGDIHQ